MGMQAKVRQPKVKAASLAAFWRISARSSLGDSRLPVAGQPKS